MELVVTPEALSAKTRCNAQAKSSRKPTIQAYFTAVLPEQSIAALKLVQTLVRRVNHIIKSKKNVLDPNIVL